MMYLTLFLDISEIHDLCLTEIVLALQRIIQLLIAPQHRQTFLIVLHKRLYFFKLFSIIVRELRFYFKNFVIHYILLFLNIFSWQVKSCQSLLQKETILCADQA